MQDSHGFAWFAVLIGAGVLPFGCGSSSPGASGTSTAGASALLPLPPGAPADLQGQIAVDPAMPAAPADTPASAGFSLLYRDDFDTLDASRWQVMTHSWAGNLALFSTASPAIVDGALVLRLLPAPAGTVDSTDVPKDFFGAEVRSRVTLTSGRVRARIKFARGSAAVSSLVTLYTPYPANDWNELDIETLGRDPSSTQVNTQVYLGAPVAQPATSSVTPTQSPQLEALGFDASADFHVYAIEWTPEGARFSVDERQIYGWTQNIDRMKLPQNVLLTIWASASADWAGAVTEATSTAAVTYDWVELYAYAPPT